MAATVTIRVYTGSAAGTMSAAVTGIDFCDDDSAVNSLANRTAYPIESGENSYEKWLKARVDVAPDNKVNNFLFWTDGTVQTYTTLYVGTTASGVTPVKTASTVATTDATTYVVSSELTWHAGDLTAVGNTTDYLVLQLQSTSDNPAGNWTQEVLYYSYDEL